MASTAVPVDRLQAEARVLPRAGAIGLAAVLTGFAVQLLFFDTGLGINFPIVIGALLAVAWFVPVRPSRWPRPADAWLPAAALALACFVALRGDRTLIILDVMGSVTLTALAFASLGGMQVVQRPFGAIVLLGLRAVGAAAASGAVVVDGLRRTLPIRPAGVIPSTWPAILRGLLLAAPLLLIFVILFASADAVFARLVDDLLDWRIDLGSVPGRITTALVAAWLTAGLLIFVSRGHEGDEPVASRGPTRGRLGSTEAATVLVSLDLLFAVFVVLQAAYLFGGRSTLDASGLTYAEYARRGFFELLAVAFAVGGLVLGLEAFISRRSRAYLGSCLVLVALTVVVLASAFLRLRLYQDAYGWTELRFYVLGAIIWLAIGAVGAIACLALDRTRWLPHGMVMLSVAFGIAFNVIGPVRYIAEQNVARATNPRLAPADASTSLDVWYLAGLGDDALIVIAERYPHGLPAGSLRETRHLLSLRAAELAQQDGGNDWQAWNLSRDRIRALVSSGVPVR
jgi:hypothetical protein